MASLVSNKLRNNEVGADGLVVDDGLQNHVDVSGPWDQAVRL